MRSVLGRFRLPNDTRISVKKGKIFEDVLCDILVVVGYLFGRLLDNVWCQEAIGHEKGEHVTFDDSCTFSHDFQGPQGIENGNFGVHVMS